MSDPIVQRGQLWLNATYGSNPSYSYVEPNGLHGSAMSAALVSAMQIELGTPVSGVFGDITKAACDRLPLKPGDSGNRVKIMQYGLYNKGYNAGTEDGAFNSFTKAVVREIQEDAGLSGSQVTDQVDGLRMGAILGVDEYKLVPGGDSNIRNLQQDLNHRYLAYTGLKACDGYYGRSTNQAIIYAIQAEEGMSADMATGFFGPSTKNYLPDLWLPSQWGINGGYTDAQIANFTILAKYALYCIGVDRYTGGSGSKYDPGVLDGVKRDSMLLALHEFQRDVHLPTRDTVGLNEWMSMLVSTGNPDRDGLACDCATQLTTPGLVSALYNDDYRIVGRYLTGTVGGESNRRNKNLTSSEIQTIFAGGMSLFCIFQDDADWWQNHDDLSGYFGYSRGYQDARKGVEAAVELGVPFNEYIYFAVDHDFMEGEVWNKVVPHFRGINAYMASAGSPYRIGIYSARNTCGIVSAEGLASSSFISDMSTGFSGNLGYPLPSNWAFDQIQEYTNSAGFGIDKDVTSGSYMGFNSVTVNPDGISECIASYIDGTDSSLDETARIGNYMTLGYEGVFGDDHDAYQHARFSLATASVVSLLSNPQVADSRIRSVDISIHASDEILLSGYPKSACEPTPKEKDEFNIVDWVTETLTKKLVTTVAKAIMGSYATWPIKAVSTLLGLYESASSSSITVRDIKYHYTWDNYQPQSSQVVLFEPRMLKSSGRASLTVTCRLAANIDYWNENVIEVDFWYGSQNAPSASELSGSTVLGIAGSGETEFGIYAHAV